MNHTSTASTTLRQPKRKPTMKQKKAVANLVGNGGNVTKAMLDAGYSVATANTPQKLTESEYVQALMVEVGLTDVDGFKLLKEGMNSTKSVPMGQPEADYAVRHKYLETFIRVRGWGRQLEGGGVNVNFINVSKGDQGEYGL